jgi:hypothetical protein
MHIQNEYKFNNTNKCIEMREECDDQDNNTNKCIEMREECDDQDNNF